MRIGFDAKWFYEGPISGQVVVRNFIHNLVQINTEHEFFIFLDKKQKNKNFPYKNDKVNLVYVWAKNNQLSNLFILPPIANKLKLDIVLFQNFCPFLGRFKKIAYIYDFTFLAYPKFFTLKERIYFRPMVFFSRFAHKIITLSESEKNRILKYTKTPTNKVDFIHLGVEAYFKPKEQFEKKELEPIIAKFNLPDKFILFVGRLNIRKNIQNLLKAIPFLEDKSIPVVIVGEKEWKMFDMDKLIAEIQIRERLVFTGPVSFKDLVQIIPLATIFCFPSFVEGFGLPPLEAMASGVPVVVSETSSLPEVCGEAGMYVNPQSPEDIADKINLLLADKELYQQKRLLGLERAKKFNWKTASEILLSIIVETAKSSK